MRKITVAKDDEDIRLDRWFKRHFPEVKHGRLEKLLRTGQVRVDGARARAATRVAAGQEIRVPPLGEAGRAPAAAAAPGIPAADRDWMRSLVIYQDDHVIALNKPPGIAVQGGERITRHLDGLLDALDGPRPKLVHRLDRDTSGVLLLARDARTAATLSAAFRERDAEKTYWALVAGVPRPPRGTIDSPLAKRAGADGRERVAADAVAGKRAVTDYAVIETAGRRVAWLHLRPHTGRTHQLRVHCAALGTPIVGDGKYGGAAARIDGLPGRPQLCLHARGISLPHPAGGRRLQVSAPLPESRAEIWRFLAFDPAAVPAEFL